MAFDRGRLTTITILGSTQTLAWASSYYLPAVLADPIAQDIGVSTNWLFSIFSGSLIISALLGPRMGRMSDAGGGNRMLAGSNVFFAVGLVLLASAHALPMLAAAWLLLGVGMGFGLYDAAFAVLGRIYGSNARGAITGITLFAGFASTIGWPLTAWVTWPASERVGRDRTGIGAALASLPWTACCRRRRRWACGPV